MSTDKWDNWLFFGGEMPSLLDSRPDVPMPDGFYACMGCKTVTDYWPHGGWCENCEYEGERDQMDRHDH